MLSLKPDRYYHTILDIDLAALKEAGFKGIVFDIDNTIVPWSEKEMLAEIVNWLSTIEEMGFQVCLLSNASRQRKNYFSDKLKIPAVQHGVKPGKKAFKEASQLLSLNKEQIVFVGDQIFTDVLGGNRAGFFTILVDPMADKEFVFTRFVRKLENFVFVRDLKEG